MALQFGTCGLLLFGQGSLGSCAAVACPLRAVTGTWLESALPWYVRSNGRVSLMIGKANFLKFADGYTGYE